MRWAWAERRRGCGPCARGGLTLVEAMVVLAILAIVAGAVAPMLPRVGPSEPVDDAAERVATVLRRAHRTALERAEPVTVFVDPDGGRYWVSLERGDGSETLLARGAFASGDVVLSGTGVRVRFRFGPDGSADGGRLLVRAEGAARAVAVDPWTGRTRVGEP